MTQKDDVKKGFFVVADGHPLDLLMKEHEAIADLALDFEKTARAIKKGKGFSACAGELQELDSLALMFAEASRHYQREENVLFPHLEKHGITGPPAQMWAEHDEIREIKRHLDIVLGERKGQDYAAFGEELLDAAGELKARLNNHFAKENGVLFPMALKSIPGIEWPDIQKGFEEIGKCNFTVLAGKRGAKEKNQLPRTGIVTPADLYALKTRSAPAPPETKNVPLTAWSVPGERTDRPAAAAGIISFSTGELTRDELESVLDMLPVDITFVGASEEVRYFSNGRERIFPRTKAIIGRKVQNCHPPKSLAAVQKILDDFSSGKKDAAEFWITLGAKMVHIRYFAIRRNGKYLGALEVSQDIAPLRKITGEKRLSD